MPYTPVNDARGSIEDLLLVLMAVRVSEVICADQYDYRLGHVDGGELPSSHDAPHQIGRLVTCRSATHICCIDQIVHCKVLSAL